MVRCLSCVIPDTRPDTHFVDGICSACRTYARRPQIDWESRKAELVKLLDQHDGRCIVPSSGGKDSHYQVLQLLELGASPTIVTATTCQLSDIGRRNIENLARYAPTIEVTPNRTVRAKLNRLGLELVGDISWPEHASIFSVPFRIAYDLGIPLIFFGENPQAQYGGPPGADEAREMTLRWRSEFGGFLGLRPSDFVGQDGIRAEDMRAYEAPSAKEFQEASLTAYFLGQFIPWDSHRNAELAAGAGFTFQKPTEANWWAFENQDNVQTGLHDHAMYRKFGYGRGAAQIAVDVREGRVRREEALKWVRAWDGQFPFDYLGHPFEEVLERIGLAPTAMWEVLNKFTNWALFDGVQDGRPALKEAA